MSTVTLNGLRLNDANSNTNWNNFNSGGPSPAAEPQLAYQKPNAVNKKVSSTTSRTGVQYTHGSSINMTTGVYPLWVCKVKVADAGDLNTVYGVEATIGSGSGARHSVNLSGTGANNDQFIKGYNSQGGLAEGYIIVAINPNVAQWRDATTGSPLLTGVNFFAAAAQFVVGGAKSENVALDAIDVGVGLNYSGASFSFQDGVDTDQAIDTNRWGWSCANGVVITLRGLHRILAGSSGTDISTVLFPDGYHDTGNSGIEINTTTTTVQLNGVYTGLGKLYGTNDTRPDLKFINSGSASSHSGSFNNHRLIQLQSVITMNGAILDALSITQNGATILNSTIVTRSLAGVATLVNPTLGNITATTIQQKGTGHAVELQEGVGDITLTGVTWNGYGADGSTSAAINYTGIVPINLSYTGGTRPTTKGNINILDAIKTITFPNVPIGVEFVVKRGSKRIFHIPNTVSSPVIWPTQLANLPVKYIFNGAGIIKTLENTLDLTSSDQTVPVQFESPESYV